MIQILLIYGPAILSFTGTLILAKAADVFFTSVITSFNVIENVVAEMADSIAKNRDVLVVTGMDKHRNRGLKKMKLYTYWGLSLIALGTLLQITSEAIKHLL